LPGWGQNVMSGPGLGIGPGLGAGIGSGPGGNGSGPGPGGSGSGAGPGGVGSGAGADGSGSIGGMLMSRAYPAYRRGNLLDPAPYRRGMLPPEVVAYYECGDEQDRLTGRIEWARTWDLLERFLPAPPATILDVGGGPGAYAVPLALAGHAVHLVDSMPLHVRQARAAAAAAGTTLASAEVGDARALAFPDTSADAVLLLGPLYHLLEAAERDAALAEARRVLRPGGVVIAVAISRFASLYDGLDHGWAADHRPLIESGLHTGTHRNPQALRDKFTTVHFARPQELADEVTDAGFTVTALVGIEGPGRLLADVDDWLDDPDRREWLLHQLRRVEAEPSLLGASQHVMAVARK
jgi:ubiquinone/menaquinone biosynthesis C-methylase UbiE